MSLPLERRLAQTFAHVFPSKRPLSMLQDMEDSEQLMDKFCDSDFLERLDQVLVHVHAQAEVGVHVYQDIFVYWYAGSGYL